MHDIADVGALEPEYGPRLRPASTAHALIADRFATVASHDGRHCDKRPADSGRDHIPRFLRVPADADLDPPELHQDVLWREALFRVHRLSAPVLQEDIR